ncbi:phage tail protein [Escherichia coli]|uniref:phage tail protein n=1 Tax=Escherichia coli TaxID=562 RepID=UPI00202BA7B6|nr:phage tail protein [Escherichia coli]
MMPVSHNLCIFLNVGLGEGSALPVGVPVPWPSATPPTGWLKCNGAAFSAEEYPELAKAYPTNKLPDLRGEFIRGWDDGAVLMQDVFIEHSDRMLEKHRHIVVANDGYDTKMNGNWLRFQKTYTQGRDLMPQYRRSLIHHRHFIHEGVSVILAGVKPVTKYCI